MLEPVTVGCRCERHAIAAPFSIKTKPAVKRRVSSYEAKLASVKPINSLARCPSYTSARSWVVNRYLRMRSAADQCYLLWGSQHLATLPTASTISGLVQETMYMRHPTSSRYDAFEIQRTSPVASVKRALESANR